MLKEKVQRLWEKAQEALRIESELSSVEEKYEEQELRIKVQKKLNINLLAVSVELLKTVERILKHKIEKDEKSNGNRKQKNADSKNTESISDSSGDNMENIEQ